MEKYLWHSPGTIMPNRFQKFSKYMDIKAFVILACIVCFASKPLLGQNQGEPVFRQLTLYSFTGGAIGAGTGAVVWLTNPAGKDNKLGIFMLTGFAIGCIVGAGYGVYDVGSNLSALPFEDRQILLDHPIRLAGNHRYFLPKNIPVLSLVQTQF